jgi:RNA polymerase sigma factor (sigma-70 family)
MKKDLSDESIITGIKLHNKEILDYIYKSYYPVIEGLVIHNSGSRDQAQDVFQEAMMVIYDKIRTGGLTLTCKFGTYLYAVCKNIWSQERKKYKLREGKLKQQVLQVQDPGPAEDPLYRQQVTELFNKHFRQLSRDCQKILTMYFNDFTVEEIREAMDYKDVHHAADRKYRCKKSLIKRMVNDPLFKRLKDEQR